MGLVNKRKIGYEQQSVKERRGPVAPEGTGSWEQSTVLCPAGQGLGNGSWGQSGAQIISYVHSGLAGLRARHEVKPEG